MPRCLSSGLVRAPTQYQSAKCADVVQILVPFSTQPPRSSSRTALSCMLAASEPASGSLYPTANSISAFRIFGRNSFFSQSLP